MSNRVSEAEQVVLDILWQKHPQTSLEVVEQLSEQGWNEKTVKTFLNRLVKKSVISYTKDGRKYLYSPAIERETFLAEESEGFLDKMFRGDVKELLTTFVNNKTLSKTDLDYLKGLLDDE